MPQNANNPASAFSVMLLIQHLLAKGELGNVDVGDLPGDTTVIGRHLASNALPFAHSLVIVRVGSVEGDDGVNPLVGGHGTAVVLATLNSTAPALSVTVAGAEGCDLLVVDGDVLGVVSGCIIELVFTKSGEIAWCEVSLTVHSDPLAVDSVCAVSLNGHLSVGRGAKKSVCEDAPGVLEKLLGLLLPVWSTLLAEWASYAMARRPKQCSELENWA